MFPKILVLMGAKELLYWITRGSELERWGGVVTWDAWIGIIEERAVLGNDKASVHDCGHDWLRQVEEIRRKKENLEAMFWELGR